MDKKKTKNKNHNKKKHSASNQLAKFRGWIQAGATLLTNIHLPNFFKGEIYQGKGKAVCVPGLNCYSCPAASGACPIGSFQAVVGSSKYKFSYYITGFLILLGVLLGRFICGFLCPFGWLQDLLHKVPTKKFSTKKLKPLTYIKYAVADYVSIVTNGKNWSSFFEEMLVRPEETRIAGGKEAKIQWILRLSAIKNKLSKESYSVPVDEYSYVKSVYDWIMEMLTL